MRPKLIAVVRWGVSFVYEKCEEVDLRRRFQYTDALAAFTGELKSLDKVADLVKRATPLKLDLKLEDKIEDSNKTQIIDQILKADGLAVKLKLAESCAKASEAQTRSRVNHDASAKPPIISAWSKWSGTPTTIYSTCKMRKQDFDTPRVRWYQINTNDGSCTSEKQVRIKKADGKWGVWAGSYVYEYCADYQSRTQYATKISINAACQESVARRERMNKDKAADWNYEGQCSDF